MHGFRSPLADALIWAMVPVALWAGAPFHGCVCVDGQVKLFCARLLLSEPCRDCRQGRPQATRTAQMTACDHNLAAHAQSDPRPACCRHGAEPDEGPSACDDEAGCRLIGGGVLVRAEATPTIADGSALLLHVASVDESPCPQGVPLNRAVDRAVQFPALDRIIAHCRFVI